ncbi:MAG: Xaa-Pro peptidase family protein [Nitrospinota bacterium]|nr:Xaa-Pro peptidase family protein [Nitrospinota bacterium]
MILEDTKKAAGHIQRRRAQTAVLADWDLYDALMVTSMKNVRYLTGFSGTAGVLLLARDEAWLITDFRYVTQAAEQTYGITIHEAKDSQAAVEQLASRLGIKSIGFEADHMAVSSLGKLEAKLDGIRLEPTEGVVEQARLVKDEAELEALDRLVDILGESIEFARSLIQPGALERDIAIELETAMRKKGADGPAFEMIVASGARGALPHGVASAKAVEKGDAVTLDWGARGWGYHSDNTRTFLSSDGDKLITEIYKVVLEANEAAIDAIRPGVPLNQVDDVARSIIVRAGYGDYFGHGTGHGVGLDIHEEPKVSTVSLTDARPGMVFTVEPGIYVPGVGGVRIEDMVLVTQTGHRVMSERIPKSPKSMVLD